jgi:hypothetical protein
MAFSGGKWHFIALSFPEMVILRRVLTPKLIAVFVGVVATGYYDRGVCVQPGSVIRGVPNVQRNVQRRPRECRDT